MARHLPLCAQRYDKTNYLLQSTLSIHMEVVKLPGVPVFFLLAIKWLDSA